VVAGV